MSKKYNKGLHVFRRDLRLEDNTALLQAVKECEEVSLVFVFDPVQCDPSKNEFFSRPAFQFLCESLAELSLRIEKKGGRLYFGYGKSNEVLEQILQETNVESVYVNKDYTPFSKKRDGQLQLVCERNNVNWNEFSDVFLVEPGSVLTDTGQPYKVFTPFFKKASVREVARSKQITSYNFDSSEYNFDEGVAILKRLCPVKNDRLLVVGGRSGAMSGLAAIEDLKEYKKRRDYPSDDGTTLLSPYLKFGCVSPREVYWQVRDIHGSEHTLINELFWRDFYGHLVDAFPHVMGSAFQKKYKNIAWENDKGKFAAWCEGKTGFPIVDAGMRQINETGWMHNRVRMIVASFLTKDLHIDWRWGEKYFAQHLIDYDPASNNGGWQWAASTGADSQPYFRIFNPWRQQERFDKDCEYIKEWIPELRDLSAKEVHKLIDGVPEEIEYPAQIIDHKTASARAKEMFKMIQ